MPRAFQVRHFGAPIHPQTASDNPNVMAQLSQALMGHASTLPQEVIDYRLWTSIHSEEDTDILTIKWDPTG